MNFFATCKLGLESLVALELKRMKIEPKSITDARVEFSGGFEALAKASINLRCAERVYLNAGEFQALTFDELFEGVKALDWKQYLARDAKIYVKAQSAKSKLFSVSDCQSIIKKAIVENLRRVYNTKLLPETGNEVIVTALILRDRVVMALDASGAGLSRRGYRTYNVEAPIAETLGAAIVLLSGFRAYEPLIDPMCGSGTMPIEAAMIAQNRAPGINREFAAQQWPFMPKLAWENARQQALDSIKNDVKLNILGSDIDSRSIDLCKQHAKKAGIMINWAVQPVKELTSRDANGIIVCNPPYGERMLGKYDAEKLYKEMRTVFDALNDWSVNVISSNLNFERIYGKRADKRRKLSNGGKQCMLYQFGMNKSK